MMYNFSFFRYSLISMILVGCVHGEEFNPPKGCTPSEQVTMDVSDFVSGLEEQVKFVEEEIILKLYITSSDQFDNIYGAIYMQDDPLNPVTGFELRTDLVDYYLLYPSGSQVYLKLKGLYARKSKGGVQVGSSLNSFGNLSIGRLPATVTKLHLKESCHALIDIRPKDLNLDSLEEDWQYLYVRFEGMQFSSEDLCKSYSESQETTLRKLVTCEGRTIVLENSGYSEFYDQVMPPGNGSSTGILKYNGSDLRLLLNHPDNLEFNGDRCEGFNYNCDDPPQIPDEGEFEVIISEIADPVNTNADRNARYLELFNPGENYAHLAGWQVRRYTNANETYTEGSVIVLPDIFLPPGATYVIAANASHFEQVYGSVPDMNGGSGSAADSNGDDNIVLVDGNEQVRDVFGVPGEDGTGTSHDFQDGRVLRGKAVITGNPLFTPSEWEVFNGHGQNGTILKEHAAPEDFDPGIHH